MSAVLENAYQIDRAGVGRTGMQRRNDDQHRQRSRECQNLAGRPDGGHGGGGFDRTRSGDERQTRRVGSRIHSIDLIVMYAALLPRMAGTVDRSMFRPPRD
jgi:hypothetical protein